MSFDFDIIKPKPNIWFSPNVEYEGQGHAEFSNPHLILEGYVKIRFDQFGNQSVKMNVENVESEHLIEVPLEIKIPSVMALLTCELVEKERVKGSSKVIKQKWVASRKKNQCTKLVVSTSEGVFSAQGNVFYSNIVINFGTPAIIKFHPNRSQFDLDESGYPKYWVLPLSNFISDIMPHGISELDQHPLRIYSTPIIPDGISNNDIFIANTIANEKNKLISFRYNRNIGFIERLSDYDERKNKLIEGNERNIITAVMIGEIGNESANNFEDLEKWFPFDFLGLLGLASGSEIGAPWIELRDSRGKLVRRIHVSLGRPCFSKGHRSIDEVIHRGTGQLLTCSRYSLHRRGSYLNSIIKHLIRGGLDGILLEDKMSHLFRAFDSLCEVYNLNTQHLTEDLDDYQKGVVKQSIDSAALKIRQVAKATCNSDQRNSLLRIADRVTNSGNKERDFGLAIIDLLKKFSLPDADIVDVHYQANPRLDGLEWHQVLSYYRGVVIHESYFNFSGGSYDFYDVLRIWRHIQDILIRIVLKMLCYDGTYQRSVLIPGDWAASWSVDWVKPDTPASELGYD